MKMRRHILDTRAGLLAARVLLGVAIVAAWQLVVSLKLVDSAITSSPAAVGTFLFQSVQTPELWTNLGATLTAVIIAFILASFFGVVIGMTLALLPRVEKVVFPYLDALNSMPRIALAPIFVVAFGLTMTSKVALAFSIVLFIVITSARAGVRSIDLDILRLAEVLGSSKVQMFVKVFFPVAVPAIFGGLRLGVIYSLLGVITAELIASRDGVGQMLQQYAGTLQIDGVYGLLILLAIVASLLNIGMGALERRLLRWQPPTARG